MADRKNNNVPNSSANLLFSGAPEFNFNLPFMPVSQATGPAVLSGDDSTDVGEEDSFLGQISGNGPAPSTFNYFSSPVTTSDPFASICQSPCPPPALSVPPTTAGLVSVPSSISMAPVPPPGTQMNPAPQAFGNAVYQSPMGRHTPPPTTMTPPPPQMQPQSHNPYRHTPISSRASPYIPAPEVLPPTHTPQQNPYSLGSPPQTFPLSGPTYTKPPPTQIQGPPPQTSTAGAIVPANPMMPYNYNVYEPVQPHWFYCKQVESKSMWLPFSIIDSLQLEETYNSVQPDPENVIVRTDGGRYDVQLYDRIRTSVYWEEEPTEVRRCSWFYKGDTDSRFIPYSEEFSDKLEGEYKKAVSTNQWHRRLEFPSGETIVMHNPKVIVQFQPSSIPDEWGTTQDGQTRPRVVKRGIDDDHDEVPDGELAKVDHLVFMVHGIGPVCDLRFRSMVECVDDFRSVSLKLLHSHFKKPLDEHAISRVEFLPVQWHTALHGDATGVDRRIKKITLPSTGRLRHFTNETLLDVLFYNSPTYCQTIMDTVAQEINRLYALFKKRNPDYRGGISVSGHSLGSLILFDLLSNQKNPAAATPVIPTANEDTKQVTAAVTQAVTPPAVEEEPKEDGEEFEDLSAVLEHLGLSEYKSTFDEERIDIESFLMCTIEDLKEMGIPLGPRKKIAKFVKERVNKQAARQAAQEKKAEVKEVSQVAAPPPAVEAPPDSCVKKLPVGNTVSSVHVNYNYFEVGTGQVSVIYHTLDFEPVNFFALGSPIGMFLTVRGLEKIEESYQLPTCKGFFNIYHPLDPVAYRIEPMILPDLELKPVLIPHHKGRKRLHLELKESLTRMGSDLKHGFISSLKTAWQTLNEFARAHTASAQLQAELAIVANQIEEQEKQAQEVTEHKFARSSALIFSPQCGQVRSMATLKDITIRLKSIKNIQKITKSMKMVAAAKYARAERQLKPARVYGSGALALYEKAEIKAPEDKASKHLLIGVTSDRGLCGAIHSNVAKAIKAEIANLTGAGKEVMVINVGDKLRGLLHRTHGSHIMLNCKEIGRKPPTFADASIVATELMNSGYEFDQGSVFFNRFRSVISYKTDQKPLFSTDTVANAESMGVYDDIDADVLRNYQEFALVNIIYLALRESSTSEQSARMTAMDSASKNASEMIDKLTLTFNRTRQAVITKELIEIISGAAAL